jgi:hypothetical protein
MTRVTLSEFKNAARDRSSRRGPPGSGATIVTPMPTARAAVRRYHREGSARATLLLNQTFDRSAHWGPAGPGPAKGWANAIRTCFQTYVELADVDDRPVLSTSVDRDVRLGGNAIGVAIDVILLDPLGYVARYPLWDVPSTNTAEAELLAAPIVRAMDEELGEGRTVGVEVWHLRSRAQFFVPSDHALTRLREAGNLLGTYVS